MFKYINSNKADILSPRLDCVCLVDKRNFTFEPNGIRCKVRDKMLRLFGCVNQLNIKCVSCSLSNLSFDMANLTSRFHQ